MKKQSLTQNLIFQFLYQGVTLVIPLILSPYLSRTLQETALGEYTYVHSIAYYFVVAANLGILKHGQRVISQSVNDEIRLRKTFWSLFSIHAIVSAIVFAVYILLVSLMANNNSDLFYIESLYVLSALFDVTWLFYGLENFKSVVIKNAGIKLLECILVFCFVKSASDVWIYTLITAGGLLAGQLVMIPQAIRSVKPITFSKKDILIHMKPMLLLSITVIASTLYTAFDKTLLGLMSSKEDVAFYDYANRIVHLPATFIMVIGTVLFPRACRLAAQGDTEGQKRFMNYSFFFSVFIGVGAMFGLTAVGELLAVVYYGKSFAICGRAMMALSPMALLIGTGDVVRTQYMIPNGMDKQYTISIVLNAVANLIFSIVLIPVLGIYGAIVGTLVAELSGVCFQVVCCRKHIDFKNMAKNIISFMIIGLIMFGTIKVVGLWTSENLVGLVVQIALGLISYTAMTVVYVLLFEKNVKNLLMSKLRSK